MKNSIILFSLLALAALGGCSEEKLTPSEPQSFYTLPQGTSDYDTEFVEFFEQYNTQVLYKYREIDFRWNITTYIPFYSVEADEAYIADAWAFLRDKCLTVWPADFIKDNLPTRILLCSDIYDKKDSWVWDPTTQTSTKQEVVDKHYAATYGVNHVAFGLVNSSFPTLTEAEKLAAVGEFSAALISYGTSRGFIDVPTDFSDIFKARNSSGNDCYNSEYAGEWGYNGFGCLEYRKNIDVYTDFGVYVKYLTTMSKADYEAWAYDPTFDCGKKSGVVGQFIRKKSEAVLEYFQKTFGIDLHAIGDKAAGVE